jgi:hypothetical protein
VGRGHVSPSTNSDAWHSKLVRDIGYLRIFSPTKCSNLYRRHTGHGSDAVLMCGHGSGHGTARGGAARAGVWVPARRSPVGSECGSGCNASGVRKKNTTTCRMAVKAVSVSLGYLFLTH